jgi:hypothetical protein
VRILLPIAVLGTVVFIAAGMVQNLSAGTDVTTLAGTSQHITGGPVASQEIIKELGTNGGGFYNANSAHPFENPTNWTNWLQIFLILLIPFSLPRVFGRMVGDKRQGLAIAAQAATLRKAKQDTIAHLRDGTTVPASELKLGDIVVVVAGQTIPGDGDVIEGIASVDESAMRRTTRRYRPTRSPPAAAASTRTSASPTPTCRSRGSRPNAT